HQVQASEITGSVLVLFDAKRLGLDELIQRVAREAAAYRPHAAASAAERGGVELPPAAGGAAWHTQSAADGIRSLNDTPEVGLSAEEAERRLLTSGPNRLPAPQPKSAFEIIREQIGSLPVLLLGGAAVASIATGGLVDGAAILAVIAINAAIGYATESRVERILASLNDVAVSMAFVRRDGRERLVPRAELAPGDVMLLRPGHDVPADGRLIEVRALQTDESALTGESVPVLKSLKAVAERDAGVADRTNMVYAGTVVADGAGEAIVTATGKRTELGRIRTLVSEAKAPRTPLEPPAGRHGSPVRVRFFRSLGRPVRPGCPARAARVRRLPDGRLSGSGGRTRGTSDGGHDNDGARDAPDARAPNARAPPGCRG